MAKESIEEIFRRFEQSNPRQQTDKIYSIDGKVSEDNIGSINTQLSFLQPDFTTRSVEITSSRMCDCGKLVSQKNVITGTCQHNGCNNFTCSECVQTCSRCKHTFCPDHIRNNTCGRCQPVVLITKGLKWFFDIRNERTEE